MREINPRASIREFTRSIRSKHCYVLFDKKQVSLYHGYIAFRLIREEGKRTFYIYEFQVAPGQRRKGIGCRLLGEAITIARNLDIDVIALTCAKNNVAALRFYTEGGFRRARQSPTDEDTEYDYYILERPVASG